MKLLSIITMLLFSRTVSPPQTFLWRKWN